IPLTTYNLGTLLLTAQTNDPALLSTFFPGIVVNGFTNFWTVVCTPNVVSYLTNYYGEPVGTPGHFIIATNGFTCLPQQNFIDFFGNVITNANLTNTPNIVVSSSIKLAYFTNTAAKQVITSVGVKIGAPVGSPPTTNTTVKNITITNQISGEYFIVPTNQCGWQFV